MATLRKSLTHLIEVKSAEWLDKQPAWLGDYDGVVQTDVAGMYYARLINGKVIEVYNQARVPATYDLMVLIGRRRSLPTVWQIIEVVEAYTTPAAAGQVEYHHEQHMFGAGDMLPVDRKQVMALTVMVSDAAAFIVTVFGGVFHSATGVAIVANQTVDLSSYVVTAGAKYVSIETDDAGTLSVNEGAVFGSPAIATVDDIPVPDPGQYLIAYVLLHEGQTELADDDIRVPMPIGFNASGYLTSVSWGDIGGSVSNQTDLHGLERAITFEGNVVCFEGDIVWR